MRPIRPSTPQGKPRCAGCGCGAVAVWATVDGGIAWAPGVAASRVAFVATSALAVTSVAAVTFVALDSVLFWAGAGAAIKSAAATPRLESRIVIAPVLAG